MATVNQSSLARCLRLTMHKLSAHHVLSRPCNQRLQLLQYAIVSTLGQDSLEDMHPYGPAAAEPQSCSAAATLPSRSRGQITIARAHLPTDRRGALGLVAVGPTSECDGGRVPSGSGAGHCRALPSACQLSARVSLHWAAVQPAVPGAAACTVDRAMRTHQSATISSAE